MSRKSFLYDLPEEMQRRFLSLLTYRSRTKLSKCSKRAKELVEQVPARYESFAITYDLQGNSVSIELREHKTEEWDPMEQEKEDSWFLKDSWPKHFPEAYPDTTKLSYPGPHYVFGRQGVNWTSVFDREVEDKLFYPLEGDFIENAVKKIGKMLSPTNLCFKYFNIHVQLPDILDYSEDRDRLMELLNQTIKTFKHQISVEVFDLTFDGHENHAIDLLKFVKPENLIKIYLRNEERFRTNFEEIKQLEQWKQTQDAFIYEVVDPIIEWFWDHSSFMCFNTFPNKEAERLVEYILDSETFNGVQICVEDPKTLFDSQPSERNATKAEKRWKFQGTIRPIFAFLYDDDNLLTIVDEDYLPEIN